MTAKKTPTRKAPPRKKTPARKAAPRKVPAKKKIESGKSLREIRAEELQGSQHWPWPLRGYQQNVQDAFDAGKDRFCLNWHRRAGKDIFGISFAANQMRHRVGNYVHFFPKQVQAKRAIWNGVDPRRGARFVDIAFGDIEADRNNTDLIVEAFNGATWQMLGSDNYDRVVGANIVGVVFSEWALCDPRAWDYIRPMLLENNGWAMFITTFRGRNHAWQMAQKMAGQENWYVDLLDVTQTFDLDGHRIMDDAKIQRERDEGMSEAMINQEYFMNPDATSDGAIYGSEVEAIHNDFSRKRARRNASAPVYCFWNLDLPIHASCILAQAGDFRTGGRPRILSAHTWKGTTLAEAMANAEQQPFRIQSHIIHHDQRHLAREFCDLQRAPELVRFGDRSPVTITSNLLQEVDVSIDCELLLDSLSGYVRRERFDAQVGDINFAPYVAPTWHEWLVRPLETFAKWEYDSHRRHTNKPADYSVQNLIGRTIQG